MTIAAKGKTNQIILPKEEAKTKKLNEERLARLAVGTKPKLRLTSNPAVRKL